MARKQQRKGLRQQVERLVTEKMAERAYNLLVSEGWVPSGSGHQDHYPNGLSLYAKVSWGKQILVSEGSRYWAWEVAVLAADEFTFLYPISRQYPFDEVCSRIVLELEWRNWDVPGVNITFGTYGSGAQKFRMVRYIEGADFKLWFCRVQRLMPGGRYNDTAGVADLIIPGAELHVYDDESGPSFYVYVGDNWERDREAFKHHGKFNSKLNKEPRTYLRYHGGWKRPKESGCQYTYSHLRAPFLVHNNDLGREYELSEDDKPYYITSEVMQEFTTWLDQNVLAVILAVPIPEQKVDIFLEAKPPEFPQGIGALFCFGEWRDAERINTGRKNPADLEPASRYGIVGSPRLVSLDVRQDGTFPEVAYEGFLWCGIGNVTAETPVESLKVPGFYRWPEHSFVLRVTPKHAKDIYVADFSGQESYKESIWKANPEQRRLTDAEFAEFVRIPARTLVPITEYKGGYKQPVVLIGRELGLDEVEVVSGPHMER